MLAVKENSRHSQIPKIGDVWYHPDEEDRLFMRINDSQGSRIIEGFDTNHEFASVIIADDVLRDVGHIVRTKRRADIAIFSGTLSQ